MATALATLMSLPIVPLAPHATPIDELARLRAALGPGCPQLFMKRDDLLSFAMGGNKVRKMQLVASEAVASGADTLITCGGVQSNHARVTAAAGAALGLDVVLVLNGTPQDVATGNARLDRLFGATIHAVGSRQDRDPAMARIAAELTAAGRRPYVVPLGASTPAGALGFARSLSEISAAAIGPDVIIHSTSSGGTQAGIVGGCALFGLRARVIGVSADEPVAVLEPVVRALIDGMAERLGARPASLTGEQPIDIDARFVGAGYGIPTPESIEATELLARREGIVLDPVYTAKAMAGLIARIRAGDFTPTQKVLFWHTGGVPGYFV
jgi:1-aminocyclopropane-1-carboxylate deaminase/D-cysteine desulfhydrase-like pyridoxal-dependent ACC family enzyme